MLNKKKIVTPRVKIIQNLYSKKSNPDFDISNAALSPEPPPPTIRTSKDFSETCCPLISTVNSSNN